MLKFSLLNVSIGIHWWFWVATVLLGGGASAQGPEDWTLVGVWTGVVLVSILVHELGHALAGRHFGATPFIRLHGFGGVTFLPGVRLSRAQSILVSAAGPAAGLVLGLLVLAAGFSLSDPPRLMRVAIRDALYVNFFWTMINLLPIQPLDGGQILAQSLGPRQRTTAAVIGGIVAVLVCIWAFSKGLIFLALMLAMLAFYNFRREPVEGGVITP